MYSIRLDKIYSKVIFIYNPNNKETGLLDLKANKEDIGKNDRFEQISVQILI